MWKAFVDWLTYEVMGLSAQSHLGGAVNFFIYDLVKIFFLLSIIVFVVALIRSFFPPERTKRILARIPGGSGTWPPRLLALPRHSARARRYRSSSASSRLACRSA